jgi:hypothetical protein
MPAQHQQKKLEEFAAILENVINTVESHLGIDAKGLLHKGHGLFEKKIHSVDITKNINELIGSITEKVDAFLGEKNNADITQPSTIQPKFLAKLQSLLKTLRSALAYIKSLLKRPECKKILNKTKDLDKLFDSFDNVLTRAIEIIDYLDPKDQVPTSTQ